MALLMTSEISAQDSLFSSFQLRKQKPRDEAAGSKPPREQLRQWRQVPPALALLSSRAEQSPRQAGPPALQRQVLKPGDVFPRPFQV